MYKFEIISKAADAALEILKEDNGIYEYKFMHPANGEDVTLITHIKCINCFTVWNHTVDFDRQLYPEWYSSKCISSVLKGLPCHTVSGQDGKNTLTIAVADGKNRIEIKTGVHEEEATLTCKILFHIPNKDGMYETIIRLDTRNIPFYDAVYDVSQWWNDLGYVCAYVPESAKNPMYSSWYSFHQNLTHEEIIEECKFAKKLGMDTIILDDGWQTEDVKRGYAYCGDWESAYSKVGDMKELVHKIHSMDMKIMLWYNIAFMGKYTKMVEEFKGMYIGDMVRERYTLDPRYAKVRTYLTDLFCDAVVKWNLDGLKIDFVDSFIRADEDVITSEMDYPVLEDAVEELLKGIKNRLTEINPEILIEFRQNYVGPIARQYGNIFRVADCPDDAIRNRIGVVDLRLTSDETAIHSDMLMWNYDEDVALAAKQIINVLFSVPQISVRIERLSNEHYRMLEYYLKFWKEYKDLFINTKIIPVCPEANYSKVIAEKDNKTMCVCYQDNTADILQETVIVNGTSKKEIYLNCKIDAYYIVRNCMGTVIKDGKLEKGIHLLSVPVSGTIVFTLEGK